MNFEEILQNDLFKEIKPHIMRGFKTYHLENPHVYPHIKRFAYQAKEAKRTRFSIRMIFERMRWYMTIETNGDEFKLNSNYMAPYARMLMVEDPSFIDLFERRSQVRPLSKKPPKQGELKL